MTFLLHYLVWASVWLHQYNTWHAMQTNNNAICYHYWNICATFKVHFFQLFYLTSMRNHIPYHRHSEAWSTQVPLLLNIEIIQYVDECDGGIQLTINGSWGFSDKSPIQPYHLLMLYRAIIYYWSTNNIHI